RALENQQQDVIDFNKEVEQLTKQLEKEEQLLESMHEEFKGETGHLHVEMEKKQTELIPFSKKLNEIQSQYDICKSEISMVTSDSDSVKNQLNEAEKELSEIDELAGKTVCYIYDSLSQQIEFINYSPIILEQ